LATYWYVPSSCGLTYWDGSAVPDEVPETVEEEVDSVMVVFGLVVELRDMV